MARLHWSLRAEQVDKIRTYCDGMANEVGESPGFVWRRLVFCLVRLLIADISIDQIRAGVELLIDMHKSGSCFFLARKKIKEISLLSKKNVDIEDER